MIMPLNVFADFIQFRDSDMITSHLPPTEGLLSIKAACVQVMASNEYIPFAFYPYPT